jgi:hypothetical protein
VYHAVYIASRFSSALGRIHDIWGSLEPVWNWCAISGQGEKGRGNPNRLSTPAASSPRRWMKMKAAALEMSLGDLEAGTIVGGVRSVDIVQDYSTRLL